MLLGNSGIHYFHVYPFQHSVKFPITIKDRILIVFVCVYVCVRLCQFQRKLYETHSYKHKNILFAQNMNFHTFHLFLKHPYEVIFSIPH